MSNDIPLQIVIQFESNAIKVKIFYFIINKIKIKARFGITKTGFI